ncbi:hypothetical protein BGZ49_004126 [Haplosporangium sp. Z 27]|nr:hypothetical protein BGZ49_004126 [Haplosporangium sp. Z 27]
MNTPSFISFPNELLEIAPILNGQHFFTKPTDSTHDFILDEIDIFSTNYYQQYQAPVMNFQWPQGSEMYQEFDRNLARIQERQAHSTRPLDEFAAEIFPFLEDCLSVDILGFIHHIRSQLAVTARQIQQMRMENYSNALEGKSISASRNETAIAYQGVTSRNNVGSNDSPASSTINESINPLNIPEIRLEVGQYLVKADWRNCALVCKDWNQTFSKFLYSDVSINGSRQPSLGTLHKHREIVKNIKFVNNNFDASFCPPVLPNLRSIDFTDVNFIVATAPEFTAMIQSSKQITNLSLSIFAKKSSIAFWKAVSDLPYLEQLYIANYRVMRRGKNDEFKLEKELQAFWNACSRLKKLEIFGFGYSQSDRDVDSVILSLAMSKTLSNRSFPHLRHLNISEFETNITSQTSLIACCPNLESLDVCQYQQMIGDDTSIFEVLCQYFKAGNSPNLKSLSLVVEKSKDKLLGELLRYLNASTLQELTISAKRLGKRAYEELRRFFPTLRILDLRDCPRLSSASLVEILVSCPNLEDVNLGLVYAQDLIPTQSWACHRTLRSLKILFECKQLPGPSDEAAKRELFKAVFSTLGQLCNVEHLQFGSVLDFNQSFIPLDIKLSSGLWKLAGLKRLKSLEMGTTTEISIGMKEVYWMLNNWPNLECLGNVYTIHESTLAWRSLKRRGIAVK